MIYLFDNKYFVEELKEYLETNTCISIASMQRYLNISVARAGCIIDELENLGIVKYTDTHSCVIVKDKICLLSNR